MKKMRITVCLLVLLSFFAFNGCGKVGSDEKAVLKWETTEEGTTFTYGEKTQRFYQITELPFPTFWGGEAYSIITPNNELYLIDGGFQGEDGERIATYIEEHGGKVKGWFLTHPHVDHIGAFLDYMKNHSENVENVYFSPFTKEFFEEEQDPEIYKIINNAILYYEFLEIQEKTNDKVNYVPLLVGDELMLEELKLECFASFDKNRKDVNGNSLVFTLSYNDFTMLLTGDMTELTLSDMEKQFQPDEAVWNVDILQIPHHGYMAGIASDALYQSTNPKAALLDCTVEEYTNNSVMIQDHVTMIEELGIPVLKRFESSEGNKIFLYVH